MPSAKEGLAAMFQKGMWPTKCPLVAILRGVTPTEVTTHAQALLDAGFDCIEVPTNSPQWADSVRAIARMAPDHVMVGAGTVLDEAHLDGLVDAGARMAISPHTDVDIVASAVARKLFSMPGAMTASEALSAWRAGAHAVKLFPASDLGISYVRSLRAVLPANLSLLAVGGVTPVNLGEFISAGCIGAGLGSDLYRPGQIPSETSARAREFIAAWLKCST